LLYFVSLAARPYHHHSSSSNNNNNMAKVLGFIRRALDPDMASDQGHRHSLMEDVMESRIGRVLQLVPMILIFAVACSDIFAALWSAFGVQLFLMALHFYRSRYNPRVVFPLALELTAVTSYVLLIVLAYSIANFACTLVGPIVVSFYWTTVTVSLVICKPFSMQYVSKTVDSATWNSPEFLKIHFFISGVWEACFSIMVVCMWIGYGLFKDTNSTGYLILNIVIPIVAPVLTTLGLSYLRSVMEAEKDIRNGAGLGKKADEEREGLLQGEGKA